VCLKQPACTTGVTVDFARYNGLQGLVDMNDVQQGTYDRRNDRAGDVE
jgi:hypothetical protein